MKLQASPVMTRTMARTFLTCMLALGVACGDDDDTDPMDLGRPDMSDGGLLDGNVEDFGLDMEPVDIGTRDGMTDMMVLSPTSEQILAVREAELGAVDLPVDGATVTYAIEAVGSDPAGFFVQDQEFGPALFVAVDPASLSPAPAPGDIVSFTATGTDRFLGQHRVTAIASFTRDSQDGDVAALVQDVSSINDVASNLRFYESELVTVTGTLSSEAIFSGMGLEQWKISTEVLDDPLFVVRSPMGLAADETYGSGCTVEVGPTPLWRHRAEAMAMAWTMDDIRVVDCPEFSLRDAIATDDTEMLLRFSRPIEASTLMASDITFDNGLVAQSIVAVQGTIVVVETSTQTFGETYTVTVSGVTDTAGGAIDTDNDDDTFGGSKNTFVPGEGELVFTEMMINAGDLSDDIGYEWVELYNPSTTASMQLRGCVLSLRDGDGDPQPLRWGFTLEPQSFSVIGGRPVGDPEGIERLRIRLDDEAEAITISCGGSVVDVVDYSQDDFPRPIGATAQLAASVGDASINDQPFAWCATPPSLDYSAIETLLGTPAAVNQPCSGGELIISQYVEGDAGVQAVEIANAGSSSQGVNACVLELYEGASTIAAQTYELPDALTLEPDDTWTICNTGITADCDLVADTLVFDGDDSLRLVCNGMTVDRFGQIGVAMVYSTGGGLSSENQTLERSCTVAMGQTNASAPFDLLDWTGTGPDSLNDETGLGVYDCP